ncbi:unnamed protein product [Ixodes persulcatus]
MSTNPEDLELSGNRLSWGNLPTGVSLWHTTKWEGAVESIYLSISFPSRLKALQRKKKEIAKKENKKTARHVTCVRSNSCSKHQWAAEVIARFTELSRDNLNSHCNPIRILFFCEGWGLL